MLRAAGVEAIADVRSTPLRVSVPGFRQDLAPLLAGANMSYIFFGDELGGRPRDPSLYCDGVADYEAMAPQPSFAAGWIDCSGTPRGAASMPDVRGTRAARLPPLSVGHARAGRTRSDRRSHFARRRNRTARRNRAAAAGARRTRTATSSRLDRTRDSRQRIAAAPRPSHTALTKKARRGPQQEHSQQEDGEGR